MRVRCGMDSSRRRQSLRPAYFLLGAPRDSLKNGDRIQPLYTLLHALFHNLDLKQDHTEIS